MEKSFLEAERRQLQQTIQRNKRMKILEDELSLTDVECAKPKAKTKNHSCHTFNYASSGVMMPTTSKTSNQPQKRPSRQARPQCNQGFEAGCDRGVVHNSMDVAGTAPALIQYICTCSSLEHQKFGNLNIIAYYGTGRDHYFRLNYASVISYAS